MWTLGTDVEDFAEAVSPLAAADPAGATLVLSTIANVRAAGLLEGQRLGWWSDGGDASVALVATPPYPLLLHAVRPGDVSDEAVDALPGALADAGVVPVGVQSDPAVAGRIAAVWCARRGARAVVEHGLRLMRLEELLPPAPPPGYPRPADGSDLPLLRTWMDEFADESRVPRSPDAILRDRMSYRGWHLWCDDDGRPVSVAGRGRALGGVARIGPVYTPPGLRGRGFGSAVTAVATADASTIAGTVVLFADVANPTSGAMYRRLGFRDHAWRVGFWFEPVAAEGPAYGGERGTLAR